MSVRSANEPKRLSSKPPKPPGWATRLLPPPNWSVPKPASTLGENGSILAPRRARAASRMAAPCRQFRPLLRGNVEELSERDGIGDDGCRDHPAIRGVQRQGRIEVEQLGESGGSSQDLSLGRQDQLVAPTQFRRRPVGIRLFALAGLRVGRRQTGDRAPLLAVLDGDGPQTLGPQQFNIPRRHPQQNVVAHGDAVEFPAAHDLADLSQPKMACEMLTL